MSRFECQACKRHEGCKGPISPDFRGSDLLIVGEQPGEEEEAAGDPRPFIGPTGRILRATLQHITDQYTLTNAVCCFSQAKPSDKQIKACSINLSETIRKVQPKAIVVLGAYAAKAVFGRSIKVTETVGQITTARFGKQEIPIIVNFHPSYLERMRMGDDTRYRRVEVQWTDAWDATIELLQGMRPQTPEVVCAKPPYSQMRDILDSYDCGTSAVAYDYETWGDVSALRPELNNIFKILVIGVSTPQGHICFPLDYPGALTVQQNRMIVRAWTAFLDRSPLLVAHHAKYEHKCNLTRFGRTWPTADTMVRVNVVDESLPAALEPAARRFGIKWASYKTTMEDIRTKPIEAKLDDLMKYCALDAACTGQLLIEVTKALQDKGLESVAKRFEVYAMDLAHIEVNGMHISAEIMDQVRLEIEHKVDGIRTELDKSPEIHRLEKWAATNIKSWRAHSQFNPASHIQVKKLCLDILKLPIQQRKGKYTFDKETLKGYLKDPIVKNLLELRSLESMQSGFLDKWRTLCDSQNRIHTQYTQVDVVTGRLGSRDPNLQNVPNHPIRRVFTSRYRRGWIVIGDFSQLEPRLLAGWSGDESLIMAFRENLDMHLYVAAEVANVNFLELERAYNQGDPEAKRKRDLGKRMNLGTMYGQTEYGLSEHTELSIQECATLIRRYDEKFAGVAEFRRKCQAHCIKHGWVEDLFGRRRNLPDIHATNPQRRAKALRQAGNFPIASTGNQFCLTSVSLCRRLFEAEKVEAVVIGTVHDSIIMDCSMKHQELAISLLQSSMLAHNEQDYWNSKHVSIKCDIAIGRDLMPLETNV